MKKIILAAKNELNIYMNPVRQELLYILNTSKTPMTSKMLADRLHISASGVQHHISKLLSLGLVELDHTEVINGITAKFYKAALVTVQIGLQYEDELASQREVLAQESVARIYDRFRARMEDIRKRIRSNDAAVAAQWREAVQMGEASQKKEEAQIRDITQWGGDAQRREVTSRREDAQKVDIAQWGDVMTGVMHLAKEESSELMKMINDYIEMHSKPDTDKSAWEYALVLYNTDDWNKCDE